MYADIRVVTDCGNVVCSQGRVVAHLSGTPETELRGSSFGPGHVCAHTHIYSGLAPFGMPAPEPSPENFLQILERVWWRLDRALTADLLRASARVYVAESLLAGTTALVDHHESPDFIDGSLDVLADACAELGARALLCYGITERNGGREEAHRGLEECERFLRRGATATVRGMVGIHASFTVSDDVIRRAGEIAEAHGTVVHVHVAEDGADVDDAIRRGFAGPLERLISLEGLPTGSILAHGVHLSAAQIRHAEQRGYWLVHNPRSNLGNGVGYASHLGASSRVALGTDGYPAQMREEMKSVAEGHAVATARLESGLQLLGERFELGFHAEPGDAADLRVLDDRGQVQHVLVDGAVVVRDGRLVNGDIDAIRQEAQEAAQRLWARMGDI